MQEWNLTEPKHWLEILSSYETTSKDCLKPFIKISKPQNKKRMDIEKISKWGLVLKIKFKVPFIWRKLPTF